jgi:Fe-S-cluster containining protein
MEFRAIVLPPSFHSWRRSVKESSVATGLHFLKFRCTGCGQCCKDPLLPLTDKDIARIAAHTGHAAADMVRWVTRHEIEMDDEPEAFVILRQGKRAMVLKHEHGGCRYLGGDNRCTIYEARPLGCRIFPFDPTYYARGPQQGTIRHLKLIPATECPYELDGNNDPGDLKTLHEAYERECREYHVRVADWNRVQRSRRRAGKLAQTASEYLVFLGLAKPKPRLLKRAARAVATAARSVAGA